MSDLDKEEVSLAFLQCHGLFRGIETNKLQQLMSIGEHQDHEKGVMLMKEADSGDSFYLILQGLVEVLKEVPTTRGVTLERIAMVERGEALGEMSIVDNQVRSASVRTLAPTSVLRYDKAAMEKLEKEHPDVYAKILHNIASEISMKLRMIDARYAITLFTSGK